MKDLRFYGLTILALVLFPFIIHPFGGYAGLATQILIVGIATMGFNLLLRLRRHSLVRPSDVSTGSARTSRS